MNNWIRQFNVGFLYWQKFLLVKFHLSGRQPSIWWRTLTTNIHQGFQVTDLTTVQKIGDVVAVFGQPCLTILMEVFGVAPDKRRWSEYRLFDASPRFYQYLYHHLNRSLLPCFLSSLLLSLTNPLCHQYQITFFPWCAFRVAWLMIETQLLKRQNSGGM